MKKLYLVTETYPNPGGDSNFVMPELQELKKKFDVTVICLSECNSKAELDSEIQYLFWKLNLTLGSKLKYSLKYFTRKLCWEEVGAILAGGKKHIIGKIVKSLEFFVCAEEFYDFLKKNLKSDEKAVFYTFWSKYYTLPMIIHKNNFPGYYLITRLHGCDLYQERYLYGRQPFKTIMNNGLDRLYFVAQLSQKYYLDIHQNLDREKTIVCHLGVKQIFGQEDKKLEEPFLLVSCSSVIPLKRVLLIAEALGKIKKTIKWIHFGDGIELPKLKKYVDENLVKQNNLKIELKGDTPNKQIRRFYEEEYVDCFITLSSTEGCPVSVMEAMAAGIPLIGTAVGELPLMIQGNGILLKENPDLEEIAEAICAMMTLPENSKVEMRKKSKQIWKTYFDSDVNSKKIVEDIVQFSK